MSLADDVAAGLAAVRGRVEVAARAAGRDPASIRIVAVTKKRGADAVRAAYAAGQRDFGENYVQEAVAKMEILGPGMPDARWHLVGRLQANKAGLAARRFALLHGVDSLSAVAALSRAAARDGRTVEMMLQVRLGRRGGTAGDLPPRSAQAALRGGVETGEAAPFLTQAAAHEGVRVIGLMGVADPDFDARPQFAALRELSARLAILDLPGAPLGELSMGMTSDLEDAVAEGATIVRIGTAIFGERPRG